MSEFSQALLTSALTVLGGVLVLVIGQIIIKFIIDPLHEQSKIIGQIANSLTLYANVGSGIQQYYIQQLEAAAQMQEPTKTLLTERYEELIKVQWKKSDEASITLREQASQLLSTTNAIPLYSFWALLRVAPSYKDIAVAASQLIGMSNATHEVQSLHSRIIEIAKHLKIKVVLKHLGAK